MHRAEQESRKTTSHEDGGFGIFSLRGLLIAIVVCAVCALGFSTVLSAIHNRSVQQQVITATELARDRLEQIKRAAYDTIMTANYPEESYGTIAKHPQFHRTVTIRQANPEPLMKTITVTVSWHDKKGATQHVALSTIIAR